TLAGENGILLTEAVDYLEVYAGDAAGNPVNPGSAQPSEYQYIEIRTRNSAGNTITLTYRVNSSGRLERETGSNQWSLVTDSFNGLIYSDKHVSRLRGP